MAAYEQVDEFEPIPEEREGEVLTHRPVEGMPEDPEERLNFTQSIRAMVINQLIEGGKIPINDKDQMSMLKDALDGIDRQELGKKKIEAKKEADTANTNAMAKALEKFSMDLARASNGDPMGILLADKPKRDPNVFNRDVRNAFKDIDKEELAEYGKEETSEEFFTRMVERDEE